MKLEDFRVIPVVVLNNKEEAKQQLEALRRDIEIADNEDYKENLMREINHLEGILNPDGNRDDNDER